MNLASDSLGGFLTFVGSSTFCYFSIGCRKQIIAVWLKLVFSPLYSLFSYFPGKILFGIEAWK